MTEERSIYRKFIVSILLSLIICVALILGIVSISNQRLIFDQALAEARSIFTSITLARKWNASFGGVYVEKKQGIESNPFLDSPDVKTVDGRIFTKRNPATMTREISSLAEQDNHFRFHITSLNLLNPANRPDDFEREALLSFQTGSREHFRSETVHGRTTFRYMAPLFIDGDCLQCHGSQGYKVGDVRGGISVSFDMRNIASIQKRNSLFIGTVGAAGGIAIIFFTTFFTGRLLKEIATARQKVEIMAITDELTGIVNRRHLLTRFEEEFSRARRLQTHLSCVMLDIDHFKQINDTFGHLVGDAILRTVAGTIQKTIRTYDICGRYGGEEFLMVLPDTTLSDAVQLAERIRINIRRHFGSISNPDQPRTVTVSLGVSTLETDDTTIETLIKRADDQLYHAKASGRDRVESGSQE